MDAPGVPLETVIRPWRTATLVAAGVAAVELVVVVLLVAALVGGSVGNAQPPTRPAGAEKSAPKPALARTKTKVLVLNGNGQAGAAAAAASRVRSFRYPIAHVGNADRSDYGKSVVLYRNGRGREARRLARDLGVGLVGPLDGIRRTSLRGADVVLIVGN